VATIPLSGLRAALNAGASKARSSLTDGVAVVSPNWFHSYQTEAWNADEPIVAICAGWQSGKTVCLPPLLKREIQRCGPGDYGAFSSTYKLLSRKFLPELKKEFKDYADFKISDQQFIFTEAGSKRLYGSSWNGEPTIIQLGHAENPDSLESATLKAVVWDECGQRLVPEQSFRTVESRLMVNRGRMLLASRPYESGWYERLVKKGQSEYGKVKVISFPSWANPMNPTEDDPYWSELRATMPEWMFTILYEGRFTQPLGLIYDCFDYERDTCDDFPIPDNWNCYPGADFGEVNTAGIVIAEDPHSKELYAIHEYHTGSKKTTAEHIQGIKSGIHPHTGQKVQYRLSVGAGGARTEEGLRELSSLYGMMLDEPPDNNVEVQIQCVYEQIARHKLKFFRRACERTIDQIQLYSREVDDEGNVTDKIADKAKWHLMDAVRYIVTKLRPPVVMSSTVASYVPRPEVKTVGKERQTARWDLTGRSRR
jgi:hypothetical protein